jgi:tetratricopeptide (TPR) repeat protein
LGTQGERMPYEVRNTMPPPVVGRVSTHEARRASPVPMGEFTHLDDSDWIPNSKSLEDESELLTLDPDPTPAGRALPPPPAGRARDSESEHIVADDDDEDDEEVIDGFEDDAKEPDLILFQHVFSDDKLSGLGAKGWPPVLVGLLGKLRLLHAIAGGVVLAALLVTVIIVVAMPSEDAGADGAKSIAATGVPVQAPEKAAQGGGAGATTRAAAVPAQGAGTAAPPRQIPESGKSCTPWSKYPQLPWREHLEAASAAVGASGPCGLFGASPSQMAAALKALPEVGPCGFDFVAQGGMLEVFPTGKPDRRGPVMELNFVADRLFEIRLSYRESIPLETDAKEIGALFGAKPEKSKDFMGRKVQTVTDGDVVIEFVEEDWYGRKLKTVVFASAAVRAGLAAERSRRESAEKEMAAGDAALAKWDIEGALARYTAAADFVAAYGYAYVKQGVALTRLERFDEVEKVARKALEMSGDYRAHAEAFGLLAVVALYRGDVAKAIENFDSAAKTDVANGFFAASAQELKTDTYSVERVARTAARMECRGDKGLKATEKGLLARGNFPSLEKYFAVLNKAKVDPSFAKSKKEFAHWECP